MKIPLSTTRKLCIRPHLKAETIDEGTQKFINNHQITVRHEFEKKIFFNKRNERKP